MEPELNSGDFIAMKEMTDPIEYLHMEKCMGLSLIVIEPLNAWGVRTKMVLFA